jgi:hypothetical protein
LIGLGLALGLYLMADQIVFPVYDRVKAGAETVSEKEDELRKYRRALLNKQRYTQLLEQAQKSVAEGESRLIRGDNPSLAQVELQTIVEEAAKKINITLGQRNVTAAKKKDQYFNETTMTISFESTLNQLTSFLGEMRTSPKFVSVRTLQVSPVQPASEPPARGELKKTVKVSMTIAALLPVPPVAGKG